MTVRYNLNVFRAESERRVRGRISCLGKYLYLFSLSHFTLFSKICSFLCVFSFIFALTDIVLPSRSNKRLKKGKVTLA